MGRRRWCWVYQLCRGTGQAGRGVRDGADFDRVVASRGRVCRLLGTFLLWRKAAGSTSQSEADGFVCRPLFRCRSVLLAQVHTCGRRRHGDDARFYAGVLVGSGR